MASSVTLAQLRLDARLYADQRPGSSTSFISETELTRLVNNKVKELFDLLVEARGSDYYANEATVAIVAGTSRYSLPSDFFQLASVTLEWATNEHELVFPVGSTRQRIEFANFQQWSRSHAKGYRLRASQIEFLPIPTTDVTCRLQYVPTFTALVADADTFDGINGWEKMVTTGVAIEMMAIEKRRNPNVETLYAEQLARIEALKTERDAEAPKEIVDVERLRFRNSWLGGRFGHTFGPTFW